MQVATLQEQLQSLQAAQVTTPTLQAAPPPHTEAAALGSGPQPPAQDPQASGGLSLEEQAEQRQQLEEVVDQMTSLHNEVGLEAAWGWE